MEPFPSLFHRAEESASKKYTRCLHERFFRPLTALPLCHTLITNQRTGQQALNRLLRRKNSQMKNAPYSRFEKHDLILRDELAIDRTLLANERTLLAYLRSGVALIIAGTSIMHFADQSWFQAVGAACIPTGIIASIVGILRYRKMNSAIAFVRNKQKSEAGPESEKD